MVTKLLLVVVQKECIYCLDTIFQKEKNIYLKPINTEPVIVSYEQSRKFLSDLGVDGEIIHTPGYSEDSISVILNDANAFVGDLYDYKFAIAFNEKI